MMNCKNLTLCSKLQFGYFHQQLSLWSRFELKNTVFAVRIRLNLPPDDFTTASTQCICGFTLHNDPYHALCCLKISAIERHNQVKELFAQCASKLFITCSREPAGWCSSDNKRPDLLIHFTHKQTFVDITIVHPTAKSNLRKATDNGRVCREAEHHKIEKYKEITLSNSAFQFCPLVFTTFGEWGKQTAELIEELAVVGADDDCCNRTHFSADVVSHSAVNTEVSCF